MEDFVARADLIPRERLRALSAKSDGPGLRRIAEHAVALLITGILVWQTRGTVWVVPAMVVQGIVLVFLFCPLHEGVHGTAFKTRWLNDRVADVCGFLTVYPRLYYRCFHFAHHRYTQDPERDPELAFPKPRTRRDFIIWAVGRHYWIGKFGTLFRYALTGEAKDHFVPPSMEKKVVAEARRTLIGYGLIIAVGAVVDPVAVLIYWIGPSLLGQPFLRLYLLSEHTGCAQTQNMLENVRTVMAGPIVRWLAWEMPYHTEHHTFPSVPFHRLAEVHREIAGQLVHVAPSHAAFDIGLWRSLGGATGRAQADLRGT